MGFLQIFDLNALRDIDFSILFSHINSDSNEILFNFLSIKHFYDRKELY